ncbi:MAG: integrase [Halieaceae bacterium]|jgi:integrase
MALFKVNTGTREQEVACLRWDWDVSIPELQTSVFIVPGNGVKNGEDRLVVLNGEAREEAGLPQVWVHDLKHTFGRRLRAKGVSHETRQVLLGHKNGQITTHYSAAEVGELIDAVEKVSWSGSSAPTLTLTLIKNENSRKSPAVGRRENLNTA